MRTRITATIFSFFTVLMFSTFQSCSTVEPDDNPTDSTGLTDYDFGLKPHFADIDDRFDNTPADNPTTDQGVALGRFLFYEKRISKNNTIACASCHVQEYAFTDPNQFSKGFEGNHTRRNSMSITNMRWNPRFFWDVRAATLEEQTLMPIQDPIEMGMTLDEMVARLETIDMYPPLFEKAFGDPEITADRVSKALSQFVRTIISQNSKFDQVYGLPDAKVKQVLTEEEFLGYQLARTHVDPDGGTGKNIPGSPSRGANCFDCHKGALMTTHLITNNGLDSVYEDNGYGEIVGDPDWNATFKTPTLRNIEVTGPYMHDGRFKTLEEVIDHYDEHVKDHPNLDPQIKEAGNYYPGQLDLTAKEKKALVAFLKTLTDQDLLTNPKYSNPFNE